MRVHSETSESNTYPFEEMCDRKQPLTMKSDTYYAKVVNMLEAVKEQTNSFLTEQLQAAKNKKAAGATTQDAGGGAGMEEATTKEGEPSTTRGKSKVDMKDGSLQEQGTPVEKRAKKESE